MRALILVDSAFAVRERTLIARLGVALADEGVRVQIGLPTGTKALAGIELLGEPLGFRHQGLAITRAARARRLVERAQEEIEGDAPWVVHAFGGGLWTFAVEVASQLHAPTVLEVWRSGLCDRALSFRTSDETPILFLAPDRMIERKILADGASAAVRLARWGGHVPGAPVRTLRDPAEPSIMIVGNGNDAPSLIAAFEGATRICSEDRKPLIFIDADGARKAGIWRRARELGMLDRVTLVDRMEDRRELVLRGDILAHPERLHEHRTIVLDAMGAGIPVLAGADADVEAFIDARTCIAVARPDADAWASAFEMIVADPDGARALGDSARDFIRDGRRFSSYAAAVHDAYEWLVSADAVPFPVRAG